MRLNEFIALEKANPNNPGLTLSPLLPNKRIYAFCSTTICELSSKGNEYHPRGAAERLIFKTFFAREN